MGTSRRVAAAVLAGCGLLPGGLLAQRTWLVDPAGGGQFTHLQTAVNAASPGDTLLLRGSHGPVIVDRSLQIVGDQPRPAVISVQAWSGIALSMNGVDCHTLRFSACLVALEDVTAADVRLTGTTANCVRCRFDSSGTANATTSLGSGSYAVFTECALVGSPGSFLQTLSCTPIPGAPALVVLPGCLAEIADSTLTGAGPRSLLCLSSPGTGGLLVQPGGTVRIGRGVVASGGATVPAASGGGTVLHDGTQFLPPFPGGTPAAVPAVVGRGAPPGGSLQATAIGRPFQPAWLVASLGLRAPAPLIEGLVWIDPGAFVVLRIGLLDAAGTMAVAVLVPQQAPRGLVLPFQAAVLPAGGAALQAATPAVLQVH